MLPKLQHQLKLMTVKKQAIASLNAEYQDYYNNCKTLSFSTHKNIRNDKCVTITQRLLQRNKLYLRCRLDGWYYTCTRGAVIQFKKNKKITPYNSVVNKEVRKALLQVLMK
jgi:hypothetical protein